MVSKKERLRLAARIAFFEQSLNEGASVLAQIINSKNGDEFMQKVCAEINRELRNSVFAAATELDLDSPTDDALKNRHIVNGFVSRMATIGIDACFACLGQRALNSEEVKRE